MKRKQVFCINCKYLDTQRIKAGDWSCFKHFSLGFDYVKGRENTAFRTNPYVLNKNGLCKYFEEKEGEGMKTTKMTLQATQNRGLVPRPNIFKSDEEIERQRQEIIDKYCCDKILQLVEVELSESGFPIRAIKQEVKE